MLLLQGGRLLKKGEEISLIQTPFFSPSACNVCTKVYAREEGGERRKKAGRLRENINDSLTTRAGEKTAAGKSVSDHLPAGMHDSVFLKAAALQKKDSCLVSRATKGCTATALFVCLECS